MKNLTVFSNSITRHTINYWFRLLRELHQTNRVIINAGNLADSDGKRRNEHGIVKFHAYTITDIRIIRRVDNSKVKLLKIRNPHGIGSSEWTGAWSDR